jgi:NADH:ubiquinone oxidoreductase subunit E
MGSLYRNTGSSHRSSNIKLMHVAQSLARLLVDGESLRSIAHKLEIDVTAVEEVNSETLRKF